MQPTIELAKSSNTLQQADVRPALRHRFRGRLEKEIIPALRPASSCCRTATSHRRWRAPAWRGVDRQWLRNLYGFAIAPHMVFYLNIDVKTLIGRVLESRGMDYWESGMDLKHGDDIYDSFRTYQNRLMKEYASMSDEFHFRTLDARRSVDRIQDELRRQVASFLEPGGKASADRGLERIDRRQPVEQDAPAIAGVAAREESVHLRADVDTRRLVRITVIAIRITLA